MNKSETLKRVNIKICEMSSKECIHRQYPVYLKQEGVSKKRHTLISQDHILSIETFLKRIVPQPAVPSFCGEGKKWDDTGSETVEEGDDTGETGEFRACQVA